MKLNKKRKGYALLITIVVVFFISTLILSAFTLVYRNNQMLEEQKIELRERVK